MSFLRLQYTRSDGEVDTYHLKAGRRYNVGRGSSCEVRILDMRLSRQHCAVECVDGQWTIADLGSTNGCKINKKRVQDSVAVDADTTVTLGSVEIYIASISEHLDDNTESPAEHEAEETDSAIADAEQTVNEQASDDELDLESADGSSDTLAGPASDEADEQALHESDDYNPTTAHHSKPDSDGQKEETKTVFISALGKRVGPITRSQARELKKRELQGALTEDELDQYIEETT